MAEIEDYPVQTTRFSVKDSPCKTFWRNFPEAAIFVFVPNPAQEIKFVSPGGSGEVRGALSLGKGNFVNFEMALQELSKYNQIFENILFICCPLLSKIRK